MIENLETVNNPTYGTPSYWAQQMENVDWGMTELATANSEATKDQYGKEDVPQASLTPTSGMSELEKLLDALSILTSCLKLPTNLSGFSNLEYGDQGSSILGTISMAAKGIADIFSEKGLISAYNAWEEVAQTLNSIESTVDSSITNFAKEIVKFVSGAKEREQQIVTAAANAKEKAKAKKAAIESAFAKIPTGPVGGGYRVAPGSEAYDAIWGEK